MQRKTRNLWIAAGVGLAILLSQPAGLCAQARPSPGPALQATYERLLREIKTIKIFDHHAHPGYADDPDVDAMALPPSSTPLRERDTNPELVAAAKALFGYPYSDLSPEHTRWLIGKKREMQKSLGQRYFSHVLDQVGIEASAANRAAMADYLDPKRFRWVFFVDSFLFPFDNRRIAARNPDEAVFMPLQEKMLHRYLAQAGLTTVPQDFSGYLQFITRTLVENQRQGGIAMKFEVAYFRSLHFADPPREAAEAVFDKYRSGGVPSDEEYKTFQDFIFRYLITEGGRLHLPVHIHTAVGAGDYFSVTEGNVMNLENVLRDPRYLSTAFVLLHAGYPFWRQVIWLAAMKNVYLDTSANELLLYPSEFKQLLKLWLETYPEKVTFGSDAFPYNAALGAEEAYWLGVKSAREALAEALAEMVCEGEVTEMQALQIARGYLHDNAVRLYPSLKQ